MIAQRTIPTNARAAQIARDFPILHKPTSRGKRLVYLDSAASSQKPKSVIDSIVYYYENDNANVHRGVYELADRATNAFEGARTKVARFVNAAEDAEIIFVRNASEAVNLVSHTWGEANIGPGDTIVLSPLEHHSNMVPWQLLAAAKGAKLRYLEIDERGDYVLDNLAETLNGAKLVAISHVSNTLGTVAPLETIVPLAHAAGAVVLVDGAQSVPHMPIDVQALDVDFFCASGHKMLGPTGAGFLYGKRALLEAMPPFLTGGHMIRTVSYETATFNEIPWKFEAGTSNIAEAVMLGSACDYLTNVGMDWVHEHERAITGYALERLSELRDLGLVTYGPADLDRRGGVISFNFGDIHPHDLASLLDVEGVCVRAGHHCTMPLMERMGWPATARASFYLYNTQEDVDALVDALHKAAGIFKIGPRPLPTLG
jgi:cysteine desulfurase/selenocysteine lyase